MPTIIGSNGNDTLNGTGGDDTINPLLGRDTADGLGGSDTLIIDYTSAPIDPFAGASPANTPSVISSVGGSFSGRITAVDGSSYVDFFNVEHLQVTLDFWDDIFILDGAALASGATIVLDGGARNDTLDANLSALAVVNLQFGPGGTTASFGTILSFETFKLNLTAGNDTVTTGAGNDTLNGNGGDDVLNSGGGNDIISGGTGSNTLNAGDGDDQITSSGVDQVDGGAGYDRLSADYSASSANFSMVRNQAAGTATLSNGTTLTGIEQITSLTTGSGNDLFTVSQSEGTIIAAGAGEDTLNLIGNGFNSTISADGPGAFKGTLTNDQFSGIEHLNFVSGSFNDLIVVNASPLLSGATMSLDAAGGTDTLGIDLSTFGAISFIVAPDGSVIYNIPATLLNFEAFQITTGTGADIIVTGTGNDIVHANGGNDTIDTGAGNDLLDGGLGADGMIGGAGDDLYVVDDSGDMITENAGGGSDEIQTALTSYSMAAIANVERLTGTSNAGQTLIGNGLANTITGGAGNDYIVGGGGADFLWGRAGDDTYLVEDAAAIISENDGDGTDTVNTTVSYTLSSFASVEILSVFDRSTTNAIDLTGSNRDQTIYGNSGVNVLAGGGGTDILVGLGGNDSYTVDSADDQVIEAVNGGADIVIALTSYALAAGSEVETLSTTDDSGTAAINLVGNEFAQSIIGNNGKNYINGAGGADTMIGRGGNDTYIVDNAGDVIVEAVGQGFENVAAGVSYSLNAGAEVEVLSTTDHNGTAAIYLVGNEFAQSIIGNNGSNYLNGAGGADLMIGRGGDDTYIVDNAGDAVIELIGQGFENVAASVSYVLTAGSEIEVLSTTDHNGTAAISLVGNEFAQSIFGNNGSNYINGAGGADTMIGRGGDDTYIVDNAGDAVIELIGQGFENVAASVSYVLTAGSEIEVLSTTDHNGTAAISLVGNEFAQSIFGNNGSNYINGAGGADTMIGRGGDDTYIVDNAGDAVIELIGQGFENVAASVSYVLTAGSEIEVLSTTDHNGTAAISLVGNEFAQSIFGNNGSNYINGAGGADTMIGRGGDDTYVVDNAGDVIVEVAGQGFENVATSVSYVLSAGAEAEVLSTTDHAGTGAINLTGNEFSQSLIGNAGNNILDGRLGNDLLIGGSGADTFQFTTALGSNNIDTIRDLVSGSDRIALDDAVFTAIGAPGALDPNAFFAGSAAHDGDDRIIYDQATGNLYYDADGNGAGAQILFATLETHPAIAASDFSVI